jgi:hypothetical protein
MTVFIDWLKVFQDHGECPVVGSVRRYEWDLETGELRWDAVVGMQSKGSYDTGLYVRSDGQRVEVSGNPSKWCRLDNLIGVETMAEALEVFNSVLRRVGVPEFELQALVSTVGEFGGERLRKGPVITGAHVTRNLVCGS